jgi:prevent-host-death family protein
MKQQDDLHVNAFDAKTHLSQMLREAERGRSITITRNGKPVARLVPVHKASEVTAAQLVKAFRDIRQAAGKPIKVKQLIREGRKH